MNLTFKHDFYRKPLQNCFKTCKYCDNTRKCCTRRWTHFSSIGSILLSIVTILASIEQVNTPVLIGEKVAIKKSYWNNCSFMLCSNPPPKKLHNIWCVLNFTKKKKKNHFSKKTDIKRLKKEWLMLRKVEIYFHYWKLNS